MDEFILIKPSKEYRTQIREFQLEFLKNRETMHGGSALEKYINIHKWMKQVRQNENPETCAKNLVPSTQFLTIRKTDNKLVGLIDVRHELNDFLFQYGGHIGYCIRKSERGKGYAKEQLRLALAEAKKLGISKVLITCSATNKASQKTILSLGGVLENETNLHGTVMQRYWVDCL